MKPLSPLSITAQPPEADALSPTPEHMAIVHGQWPFNTSKLFIAGATNPSREPNQRATAAFWLNFTPLLLSPGGYTSVDDDAYRPLCGDRLCCGFQGHPESALKLTPTNPGMRITARSTPATSWHTETPTIARTRGSTFDVAHLDSFAQTESQSKQTAVAHIPAQGSGAIAFRHLA